MVKYACKVTSGGCLRLSFTAVHEDVPKCMSEEIMRHEPVKLSFNAGSNPAVRRKTYRQVDWLSFGTKRYAKGDFRVRERFIILLFSDRRHSARIEKPSLFIKAVQKQALPESGYRAHPSGAKRNLSAPCRKHSNFQPLLLHE